VINVRNDLLQGRLKIMQKIKNFLIKNLNILVLSIIFIYMLLLGLGTIGELFKINWILKLPLFNV